MDPTLIVVNRVAVRLAARVASASDGSSGDAKHGVPCDLKGSAQAGGEDAEVAIELARRRRP